MAAVAAISSSKISPLEISEDSMVVPKAPIGRLVNPDPSPDMVPVVTMFWEPKFGLILVPAIAAVFATSSSKIAPLVISGEPTELATAKVPNPEILPTEIPAVDEISESTMVPSANSVLVILPIGAVVESIE